MKAVPLRDRIRNIEPIFQSVRQLRRVDSFTARLLQESPKKRRRAIFKNMHGAVLRKDEHLLPQ